MKKLILILMIGLMAGCAGFELTDDVNTNSAAYLTGRASYFGAAEVADKLMKVNERREMFSELEARYKTFLDTTVGIDMIPSEQSVKLFNDLIFVMTGYVEDPYLLLADLTFLLQQYGATFVEGIGDRPDKMVQINEIPRNVYVNFDLGWHVSARVKK